MRGFSKVVIAGNITRDPELRSTPSGASVCGFSVAVNRMYRDSNGEMKEDTSYIDCSAWGRPGETIAQYMHKGAPILVTGRLAQHSWEDKQTGQKRSRVEIVVEDFTFLGAPNGERAGGRGNFGATSAASTMPNDLPVPEASANEEMPDDIPEGEVELGEIPF